MNRIARLFAVLVLTCTFLALVMADAAHAADKIRVGEGPFITGGACYIARDKGYFQKVGKPHQPLAQSRAHYGI